MQSIEVVPGIYRGPQPVTDADWQVLVYLNIKTVLKLNFPDEGGDGPWVLLGRTLINNPMPPRDLADALGRPEPELVARAVGWLATEALQPIYVHCRYGINRTGLVVAEYRVLHQGWGLWKAFREWLSYGLQPPDLLESWYEFAETYDRSND